jgi:hypothetical protein
MAALNRLDEETDEKPEENKEEAPVENTMEDDYEIKTPGISYSTYTIIILTLSTTRMNKMYHYFFAYLSIFNSIH